MKYDSNLLITDNQGYLKNPLYWTKKIAIEIAKLEGIILNQDHWQVINFIRIFYLKYNTSPAIRILLKEMLHVFGKEKGNSIYLFQLFPQGPAKQATKIAGLPKPVKCL